MPIKYVPFLTEPVDGQAILENFNRILRYNGADEVSMTLQQRMPLYEMEQQKTVSENVDGNMGIRGVWHSDNEIKIDKLGYIICNSQKTKTFWNGTIQSEKRLMRLKVQNICGDETIWVL